MAVNRFIEEGFVSPGILRERAERQAQATRMSRKPKEAFTLVLYGQEIPVLSGRIVRSIDTVADGWSAEIPWTPGKDRDLDRCVRYKSFAPAQVYLGPRLVNTGRLYAVTNSLRRDGRTKSLEGWSLTKDLVDSTIPPAAVQQGQGDWQYQWTGLSVWNFANAIVRPLGLGVKTDLSAAQWTEQFEEIQCEVTDTYAEVITHLAFARGMLATKDEYGNLFLTCPKIKGTPVGTLREGDGLVTDWKLKVDGTELFYAYTVYGVSGMGDDIQSTAIDESIPTSRRTGVRSGDVTFGNVALTAKWKRNRQLVKALAFPLPVSSWYAPDGSLWSPNTLVHVVSETLEVPKGFTFLVREVECTLEKSAAAATLSLVPPEVYSTAEEEPTAGRLWQ